MTEKFSGELDGYLADFDYCNGRIYFLSGNTPDPEKPYTEYYLNSADVSGEIFKSVKLSAQGNTKVCASKFNAVGNCSFIYVFIDYKNGTCDFELF